MLSRALVSFRRSLGRFKVARCVFKIKWFKKGFPSDALEPEAVESRAVLRAFRIVLDTAGFRGISWSQAGILLFPQRHDKQLIPVQFRATPFRAKLFGRARTLTGPDWRQFPRCSTGGKQGHE